VRKRAPGPAPRISLPVAGILTLIAVALATRLTILTGSESFLPESRPSVIELNRVAERTAGVSTFFVVLPRCGACGRSVPVAAGFRPC
jgi:predicted RND superfamily exporter protein